MPKTPEEKIAAIEARMQERKEKLAKSKLVQRSEAADKKDLQELETAKTQNAKEKAAKKRETDNGAKILLGVGVQQFREPLRSRVVMSILPLLDDRGRDRLQRWLQLRDIDLAALPIGTEIAAKTSPSVPKVPSQAVDPAPVAISQVKLDSATPKPESSKTNATETPSSNDSAVFGPPEPPTRVDPTVAAVMRVLGQFNGMMLPMIESTFLETAQGEDRQLLEVLFARLSEVVNADMPEMEIVSNEAGKGDQSSAG